MLVGPRKMDNNTEKTCFVELAIVAIKALEDFEEVCTCPPVGEPNPECWYSLTLEVREKRLIDFVAAALARKV